MKFTSETIQRRMSKSRGAPAKTGTPVGPRGGAKKLAPSNSKRAGSMFTPAKKPGRLVKGLYANKNPR